MSASLVGSEMCIRDRLGNPACARGAQESADTLHTTCLRAMSLHECAGKVNLRRRPSQMRTQRVWCLQLGTDAT
eukprot:5937045-Alexandrium_andersonii.AAC.1